MPTYEYICEKCEHRFDLSQSIKDEPIKTCPKEKCRLKKWGKGKVKRAIGAGAGLIFKGSGFYITDYRSENYKQGAKSEKSDSGGSAKAGESKPASSSSGGGSGGEAKSAPAKSETKAKPDKK
jgi:putative FmdB family regulatory protein